ncbi:MAG: rod shape-determining protein MreD [Bacteroidota bacterium]
MNKYLRSVLISLLLILLQTKVIQLLSIEGVTPDLLVIWIVYIAIKEGQIPATVAGFTIGLVLDLITGEFVGLSALAKTLCGFTSGYFFNVNKTPQTLGSYRFLVVVLIASLLHNVVYFVLFTIGTELALSEILIRYGATSTLYTLAFSLLPMLLFARQLKVT